MPTTGRNSSSTSTRNLMIYSYMTGSVEISERLGDRQDHITMKACISSSMRPLVILFTLKVSNSATTAYDFSIIQFPRMEKHRSHQRQVIIQQGIAPVTSSYRWHFENPFHQNYRRRSSACYPIVLLYRLLLHESVTAVFP